MMPSQERMQPSRHLVAFFTFIALLPLVYYVPPWLEDNVTTNPLAVTVIAVAVIVPIITYVALPGMMKLLHIFKR